MTNPSARETMRNELDKVQAAQRACLTDAGHVKSFCRYRYQQLLEDERQLMAGLEVLDRLNTGITL